MKLPGRTKLYIAGLFLLTLALLVFVQAAFNLNPVIGTSPLANQIVLLYTLSTFIFIVLLVFGFVLLRTLVKVWIERKQQKPGAKFKTSLLVSMISLTLVPATLLFLFAFGLVNRSIDKWFSAPVDEIVLATDQMSREWTTEREAFARSIMTHFAQDPEQDLGKIRADFQLKAVLLMDANGSVLRSASDPETPVDGLVHSIVPALGDRHEIFINIDRDWVGIRRIGSGTNAQILATVLPVPKQITDLTATIAREQAKYDELNKNRKSYRDTYVYILLLMTVLVLFAAVWIGLFLSRRITVPIEALSEATREISSGNLDHRVSVRGQDELGLLVTLFNDMAEQLQATTRELEARRRYMEIILESIPSGVISVDPDLRINKINRAARTMFGPSSDEVTTLDEIFGEPDLTAIRNLVHSAGTGAVSREIAFSMHGRPAHTAVTATRLLAGGFVLVVEDLTEVVRAQKANAWREVARRLAHEIKNPLTPIQLSAERIGRNVSRLPAVAPRVTTVIEECVEAIIQEVSSLKNLVDEFVRFARLPSVSRIPNSMKELVDRTLALYDDRLTGIQVTVKIPDDLPAILMDSLQMKRVLVNLLDNALDALSGETAQELKIWCELTRHETMARLTIADTGRGIAPADRERLFTPYFSTRKGGTGLGLAISSRIVADHGGYLGAEPNFPKGTRFVVELPVCQESSLSMTSPVSGSR
jgi:two-component system, NtrC family, nitrogen regulation sensor histidine kinase NtrY